MRTTPLALLAALGLLTPACDADQAPGTTHDAAQDAADASDDAAKTDAPTWHRDIQPLLARHCVPCHQAGGAAPFALDAYATAKLMAGPSVAAVEAGRMPPWQADPDCRSYEGERIVPEADEAALRAWLDAGTPEGDPADAPPPSAAPIVTPTPTLVATPAEAYVPDDTAPDDYRCLLLDATFDEDTFVTASWVVPGAGPLVHHVLIYLVTPDSLPTLEALDAQSAEPGYPCFGDTGAGTFSPLGTWVPGMDPVVQRDGAAIAIPKGSRLVMQVHYNTLTADPEPDLTAFAMTATTTPPERLVETLPLPGKDLTIAAGDPDARYERLFTSYRSAPMRVIGAMGHMHLLGEAISIDLEPAGGGDDVCLMDIPRWDFNWQGGLRFAGDDFTDVAPGDGLRLRCRWDNSSENQPTVNGEQVAPADVAWGEGTRDEMCLGYVTIERPYEPLTPYACTEARDACRAQCEPDADPTACLLSCVGDRPGCGICSAQAFGKCAVPACALQLLPIRECVTPCAVLGGDLDACMRAECPDDYAALRACVSPILATGACDEALAACAAP